MNFHIIKTLVQNEVRLRLRRSSSIVSLLAIIFLSWGMIADPSTGMTMLAVNDARVVYNSQAMALGSSSLASLLFCLLGFYLVRGRVAEDLRSGIGGVIAASSIRNSTFLLTRWLSGVLYLLSLIGAFLLSILACHLVRGEGPIELGIYLQTYLIVMLPMVFFSVSCAILFDSVAFLMGKAGDVIYFIFWVMLIAMVSEMSEKEEMPSALLQLFDFSSIIITTVQFKLQLHTTSFSIGASTFNAKLAPVTLHQLHWGSEILLLRAGSCLTAMLPLIPAFALFHRFSPDRVKASSAARRRSPLTILNQWLRPLAKFSAPLFVVATKLPGIAGQVMADLALTLATSPSAILALLVCNVVGLFAPLQHSIAILTFGTAFWGILASDISTRDFSADMEGLSGVVPGGSNQRYLRQFLAALSLGMLFGATIFLRDLLHAPLHAAILLVGMACLAALASLLGRTSRTSRPFITLFMLWVYIALNATKEANVDIVGFNGVANAQSMMVHLMIGVMALAAGYGYNRWRSDE